MRTTMFLAALALLCAASLEAQTYIDTTSRAIATPQHHRSSDPCNTMADHWIAFDFEPLRLGINALDAAAGRMIWGQSSHRYPFWYAFNTSGAFANYALFDEYVPSCANLVFLKRFVFGKLRGPQRDLAVITSGSLNSTLIYHNTLNPSQPLVLRQILAGNAVDASWGAFTSNDILEDLAVTEPGNASGHKIRIYRNLGNEYLDSTFFYAFDYTAEKIVLAQIDKPIDFNVALNKLDLVGVDGPQFHVWRNDNMNGLPPELWQTVGFSYGNILSVAVGDINGDGWNDIIVGGERGVSLYLNSADVFGTINDVPEWSISSGSITNNYLVAIGDMGSPSAYGGADRNDGWNDVVIGYNDSDDLTRVIGAVFINQRTSPYFSPNPQQQFSLPQAPGNQGGKQPRPCETAMLQISLADVQTTGGLSLAYSTKCSDHLMLLWHTGNPAPAPPKNVTVEATPPNQYGYSYPLIKWARNTERDLAGYQLWRMTTGANCGTSNWSIIADNLPATQTEYTDLSIGTVMPGGDCTARYTLKAKDNANNYSDTSRNVQINYASYIWKTGDQKGNRPTSYALHAASPNPFNPSTHIKFDLPEDSHVSLNVFDVLGRKVAQLVSDTYAAGYHSVSWDASGVASGVYFARFTAMDAHGNAKFVRVSKLLLAK